MRRPVNVGFYFGVNASGRAGMIPSNYTESLLLEEAAFFEHQCTQAHLVPKSLSELAALMRDEKNLSQTAESAVRGPPSPPIDVYVTQTPNTATDHLLVGWKLPLQPVAGVDILLDGVVAERVSDPECTMAMVSGPFEAGKQYSIAVQAYTANGTRSAPSQPVIYQGGQSMCDTKLDGPTAQGRRFRVLYDYDPEIDSPNEDYHLELRLQAGALVTVFAEESEDGFLVGVLDGRRGLVPSNFVEEVLDDRSASAGAPNSEVGTGSEDEVCFFLTECSTERLIYGANRYFYFIGLVGTRRSARHWVAGGCALRLCTRGFVTQ